MDGLHLPVSVSQPQSTHCLIHHLSHNPWKLDVGANVPEVGGTSVASHWQVQSPGVFRTVQDRVEGSAGIPQDSSCHACRLNCVENDGGTLKMISHCFDHWLKHHMSCNRDLLSVFSFPDGHMQAESLWAFSLYWILNFSMIIFAVLRKHCLLDNKSSEISIFKKPGHLLLCHCNHLLIVRVSAEFGVGSNWKLYPVSSFYKFTWTWLEESQKMSGSTVTKQMLEMTSCLLKVPNFFFFSLHPISLFLSFKCLKIVRHINNNTFKKLLGSCNYNFSNMNPPEECPHKKSR